ncbi:MAG: 2-oxoglutarate dehydrogenase E1 component [Myxococcota bacterium]
MSHLDEILRASPEYVDALYRAFQEDPRSVDPSWALFFAGFQFAARRPQEQARQDVGDLVHSWRQFGHLVADLDPLGQRPRDDALLDLAEFGISAEDLSLVVRTGFVGLEEATIQDLLAALQQTYAGSFAVEYLEIEEKTRIEWLKARMERSRNRPELSAEDRKKILGQIVAAEEFERFLHRKYPGQKRFSLEGAEALVVLLDTLVEEGADHGVEQMLFGMPHRGRLNVLTHTLKKPYEMLLAEFEGAGLPREVQGDGDVKYHLGFSHDHTTSRGKTLHLALYPNPSHLEAINPVVMGIARAKQSFLGDTARRRIMPVILHGDAAVTGQGVVYETVAMSRLAGYTVGGTINIIVNNQIGFTAEPKDYSPNLYPSDIAKFVQAPVFHVNGDDPEAAVQAGRLAAAFRQSFGSDVFINFVCYRRYGHNELDEPAFTQPKMYEAIRARPSVTKLYEQRLEQAGVTSAAEAKGAREAVVAKLEAAMGFARREKPRQKVFALGGRWDGLTWGENDWTADTRVPLARLQSLGRALSEVPAGFQPHKGVKKVLDDRRHMIEQGQGIDWGMAEALAFASILADGHDVRLSGQDAERGTFSHRHAVVHESHTGAVQVPLNHLGLGKQGHFEVVNSLLSEAAVVGFEWGMASADPHRLVIWEAQFGDFANGAQVLIDQFVASSESKWQRMSGLTLFLPHGYEGQGPEHSSARLERFLQLCAEGNMQVVNATTPAQLFHVVRRQLCRSFRKPLVMMSPKSLLRHPEVISSLAELSEGGFRLVLPDAPAYDGAERVLFCSGKVYYALKKKREALGNPKVAIIRLEQLYPFPEREIAEVMKAHPGAKELHWVQEEPENLGAWSFVRPRLTAVLSAALDRPLSLGYVGRDEAASPAVGSLYAHQEEEATLLEEAFVRPASAWHTRDSLIPKSRERAAGS